MKLLCNDCIVKSAIQIILNWKWKKITTNTAKILYIWYNAEKNLLSITRINYILKYIQTDSEHNFYRYMKHIQKRSTHCCTWCWILGRTSSGRPGTPAGGCWSCWWGVKALLPQRSVPTQQRPPAPRPSMSGSRREAPGRSRWRPDGCGCPVRRGSARRSWGCCRNPRDSPETERFPWLPWS